MQSEFIKDLLKSNVYFAEALYKVGQRRRREEFLRISKEFSDTDSISDFEAFVELYEKYQLKLTSRMFQFPSINVEATNYGHVHTLLKYAGLDFSKFFMSTPWIEHGVNFDETFFVEGSSRICQGVYKNEFFYDRETVLINNIGPFIQYAKDYYDEKRFAEVKKEWGKTLLVFPTHSFELHTLSYDHGSFVNYIFEKYEKNYDSIVACVYWNDVKADFVKEFREKGGKIVCAGTRGDTKFLRKLRTIIRLSDHVIVNDIGTNIGYCLALDRPVAFIETKIKGREDISNSSYRDHRVKNKFEENYKLIQETFDIEKNDFSITPHQIEACNRFWGFDRHYSQEEMAAVFQTSKIIQESTFGFRGLYASKAKHLLKKMKRSTQESQNMRYEVLKKAFRKSDS